MITMLDLIIMLVCASEIYVFCSSVYLCACACVSLLPLCQSSKAFSQPLPCPGISRVLYRRSQSCLLHSSHRRAGPHALSAQTTSRGTTWHTDSLAHKHTHKHNTHTLTLPQKCARSATATGTQKYSVTEEHRTSEG